MTQFKIPGMPDESQPPTPPTPRGSAPRRWSIGLNVTVQVVLSLALFAGINRLSYRYYARWDLSPQQNYTLSEATLNHLGRLSKDVFIENVFPRDSKVYGEVTNLLEEYRTNGRGRIRVRSIDPMRDVERAEALKAETGLALDQSGVVVRTGNRVRFITEDELVVRESGTSTSRLIKEFRGEDAVTSALMNVVEGKERRFYLVVGKGARTESVLLEAMEALAELGKQLNYELMAMNLSEVTRVPDDADGVLLVGLRYDLSERELKILKTYWQGKRAGLLVLLDPAAETQRLNGFLGLVGVVPRADRVLCAESTGAGVKKEFSVQASFNSDSPITRPLLASTTTLPGQTQSLEVRTDDEFLRAQSIVAQPLVTAAERYWGERNFLELLPVVDDEDAKPPVHVAASVERGVVEDDRLRLDSCRMVVAGNAALLDRQTALAVNRELVAASLNWIINREPGLGIKSKVKRNYRIHLTQHQHELIFWLTTFALPGLVLAAGFIIWAGRRAA